MQETLTQPRPQIADVDNYKPTVRIMEKLHADEFLSTPEAAKYFLDELDFDKFRQWLELVNGLETETPKSERGMTGESMIVSSSVLLGNGIEYLPPRNSARPRLMRQAFETAQTMDKPEIAGMMLGLVINAVHPFRDGNGRTARTVCALLAHGYDGSEEDKEFFSSLLENTEGRNVLNPNPHELRLDYYFSRIMRQKSAKIAEYEGPIPTYVVNAYGDTFVNEESSDALIVNERISERGRERLHYVLMDKLFVTGAMLRALPKEIIESCTKQADDGRCYILGEKLIPQLTEDQINLLSAASLLQKEDYIRNLINVADNKEAFEIVEKVANSFSEIGV